MAAVDKLSIHGLPLGDKTVRTAACRFSIDFVTDQIQLSATCPTDGHAVILILCRGGTYRRGRHIHRILDGDCFADVACFITGSSTEIDGVAMPTLGQRKVSIDGAASVLEPGVLQQLGEVLAVTAILQQDVIQCAVIRSLHADSPVSAADGTAILGVNTDDLRHFRIRNAGGADDHREIADVACRVVHIHLIVVRSARFGGAVNIIDGLDAALEQEICAVLAD